MSRRIIPLHPNFEKRTVHMCRKENGFHYDDPIRDEYTRNMIEIPQVSSSFKKAQNASSLPSNVFFHTRCGVEKSQCISFLTSKKFTVRFISTTLTTRDAGFNKAYVYRLRVFRQDDTVLLSSKDANMPSSREKMLFPRQDGFGVVRMRTTVVRSSFSVPVRKIIGCRTNRTALLRLTSKGP